MSSKKPRPCLVVLDVGHGSAAVLHDEGGTLVVDAGPPGAHVGRHLQAYGVRRVEMMILSHADADHIGGAITLLLDASVRIGEVLLNSDASKESAVFQQLCVALVEANRRAKTRINGRLTTSTRLERKGAQVEVLHPPDAWALAGAGGKSPTGERLTSNSLSAAVRISRIPQCSVLLGADIEFNCLDEWKAGGLQPRANVLVFPHHGGLPGGGDLSDAALFAHQLVQAVKPELVLFSNHRTKFGHPLVEVLTGVLKANPKVQLACTQLPERVHAHVATEACWSLHKASNGSCIVQGSLRLDFMKDSVRCCFEIATP
jgi:competence protein ComEC